MSTARRARTLCGLALVAALLGGCIEVRQQTPDEIRIDTGAVGEYVPGTRSWWGYLRAREHCAESGRVAQLVDFKGSVAVYRCVPGEPAP